MKNTINLKSIVLAALLMTAGAATTQAAPVKAGKVGFIDLQKVIKASPGGNSYVQLSQKLNASLSKQVVGLKTLQAKLMSGKATAADKQAFVKAQNNYQSALKNANAQRQKAFAPLSAVVNSAVAKAAKAQGYAVVMNRQQAASGLVVYADSKNTDLTAAVIKALKK